MAAGRWLILCISSTDDGWFYADKFTDLRGEYNTIGTNYPFLQSGPNG
jgi:hypothetical protein